MSLNEKYLQHLKKHPLLTKAVTTAVLSLLNESIASLISRDLKTLKVCKSITLRHPFSVKLLLLALFGGCINAPITHFGFKYLNKLIRPPLTVRKQLLQIVTSLLTITPVLSTLLVSYISVINSKKPFEVRKLLLNQDGELSRAAATIRLGLQTSLLTVMKTSWIVSPLTLVVSQVYIPQELWAVFNNCVFFVLGTAQNTFLKLNNRKAQKKGQDENCDKLE